MIKENKISSNAGAEEGRSPRAGEKRARERPQLDFVPVSAAPTTPQTPAPFTEEQYAAAVNCVEKRCSGCDACQSLEWRRANALAVSVAADLHSARQTAYKVERTLLIARKNRDALCTHNLYPTAGGPNWRDLKCSVCGHVEKR